MSLIQESIPVRCVPPALVTTTKCQYQLGEHVQGVGMSEGGGGVSGGMSCRGVGTL